MDPVAGAAPEWEPDPRGGGRESVDAGATNAASETIAAIATAVAPGEGGVAIVRLSGAAAEAIGRRLFAASGNQAWERHRVLYGHAVGPTSGQRVD